MRKNIVFVFLWVYTGMLHSQVTTSVSFLSDSDLPTRLILSTKYRQIYNNLSQDNQASTYLLTNFSNETVVGYVVKWTVKESGKSTSFFQAFDENELLLNSGRKVSGFGLESGKKRLVTPFANIHENQLQTLSDTDHLQALAQRYSLAKHAAIVGPCYGELDSVVYADGTFEGADQGDLVKSFMLERNAKHDAGASVLLAIRRGENEQQIKKNLQLAISDDSDLTAVRGKDGYMRARARWAQVLLKLDELQGMGGLTEKATTFATLSRVRLKRRLTV